MDSAPPPLETRFSASGIGNSECVRLRAGIRQANNPSNFADTQRYSRIASFGVSAYIWRVGCLALRCRALAYRALPVFLGFQVYEMLYSS